MSMTPNNAPQPRSSRLRKILLIGLVFALLAGGGFRVYQSLGKANKAKVAPVTLIQLKPTELLTVALGGFEQTLPLSGALTPFTQVVVSSRAAGELQSVLVREGQAVTQGQVMATIVDTTYRAQLDQARSNVTSAISSLGLAQKNYDNNMKLVEEKFISKMALQSFEVALANAQAQVNNMKNAQVIAERAIAETSIKAPVSGVVSVKNVDKGGTVAVGTAMFTVVNVDQFELAAPISSDQIGLLHPGQVVELSSAGVVAPYKGVVSRVNPAAQNGSRSYLAYIRVDNGDGQLKSGMFAQGKIVLSSRTNVITVPATAIHHMDDRDFVYSIKEGKLSRQDVTLGARASAAIDAPVEITSGVSVGDQIIRLDMGVLKVGVDVKVLDADATSPAPASVDAKPVAAQTAVETPIAAPSLPTITSPIVPAGAALPANAKPAAQNTMPGAAMAAGANAPDVLEQNKPKRRSSVVPAEQTPQ